jgi:hypothetical protein
MALPRVIASPRKEDELSSSSSSWSTIPSSPPLEDNEHESALANDTLSVLEGLLLCGGNYGLEETAPSVHLLPQEDCEAREMVAPLPLFFATRFRTLDAERSARPPARMRRQPEQQVAFSTPSDPCYSSDWYDMFAWLTAGESNAPSHEIKRLPWNGHLSLGPDQPSRRIRRKRQHNVAAIMSRKQQPLLDQENVNPHIPRTLRPLPIIPVNQPGHEDWEMIFLSVCHGSNT